MRNMSKLIFNLNLNLDFEDEIALFLFSPANPTEKVNSRLKLSFNFNLVGSLTLVDAGGGGLLNKYT